MAFIMASDSKKFSTFSKKEKATTAKEIINLFIHLQTRMNA